MNDLYKIDLYEIKNYMLYTTSIKYNIINKDKNLVEDNNNLDNSKNSSVNFKKLASIDYNKMQRKYNEKKKLFYEDKLFWCFYKLYKNMEDVDIENLNIMKEEKDFKINVVNKIHNNKEIKDLLKKHKFKKNLIEDELLKFSPTMAQGERWLVLNKLDLLPEDEVEERCQAVIDQLNWQGPVFRISGLTSNGTKDLCATIMDHIDELRGREREDAELIVAEDERRKQMQLEARQRIEELAESRKQARKAQKQQTESDDDDFDDDDYDVEVVYAE